MNKPIFIILALILLIFFGACRNKTVQLLTKKWDCVQVENMVPPGTIPRSPEDSANSVQLQSVLQAITWTFKNRMRYECAVNNMLTVQGKYQLRENDKIMVCTSSNNNINRYIIKSLTQDELILSGSAANESIVLHFKAQ